MLLLLLACSAPDSAETLALTLEATDVGTVYRATWDTPAAGSSWVEYGEDGAFDHRIDGGGEALLVGLAASTTWSVRAAWDTDGDVAYSPVETIETPDPPTDLFETTLTVPPDDELRGFYLGSTITMNGSRAFILDRLGRPTWWHDTDVPGLTTQARLSDDGEWIEYMSDLDKAGVGRIRLDGSETQLVSVPLSHHDFRDYGDNWLIVVGDDREVDGDTVRGDVIAEVDATGTILRTLWSAWDHLTVDKSQIQFVLDDGTLDWTHVNSFALDEANDRMLVSLYGVLAVAQVKLSTGEQEWLLSSWGDGDLTALGDAVLGPAHTPVPTDDGFVIFENGPEGRLASQVLDIEVDTDAHTWAVLDSYRTDPPIYAAVLGDVELLDDGSRFIDWGSAGRIQVNDAEGNIRSQIDTRLGGLFGFVHHVPEIAGATW